MIINIIHPGKASDNYYTANDIITLLEINPTHCAFASYNYTEKRDENNNHYTAAMADNIWQQQRGATQ